MTDNANGDDVRDTASGPEVVADYNFWGVCGGCGAEPWNHDHDSPRLGQHRDGCPIGRLEETQRELKDVRERVAAGPYCYACGRMAHGAPDDVRRRFLDAGFPVCLPSDCPAWNVTAKFDHNTREWVPLAES